MRGYSSVPTWQAMVRQHEVDFHVCLTWRYEFLSSSAEDNNLHNLQSFLIRNVDY